MDQPVREENETLGIRSLLDRSRYLSPTGTVKQYVLENKRKTKINFSNPITQRGISKPAEKKVTKRNRSLVIHKSRQISRKKSSEHPKELNTKRNHHLNTPGKTNSSGVNSLVGLTPCQCNAPFKSELAKSKKMISKSVKSTASQCYQSKTYKGKNPSNYVTSNKIPINVPVTVTTISSNDSVIATERKMISGSERQIIPLTSNSDCESNYSERTNDYESCVETYDSYGDNDQMQQTGVVPGCEEEKILYKIEGNASEVNITLQKKIEKAKKANKLKKAKKVKTTRENPLHSGLNKFVCKPTRKDTQVNYNIAKMDACEGSDMDVSPMTHCKFNPTSEGLTEYLTVNNVEDATSRESDHLFNSNNNIASRAEKTLFLEQMKGISCYSSNPKVVKRLKKETQKLRKTDISKSVKSSIQNKLIENSNEVYTIQTKHKTPKGSGNYCSSTIAHSTVRGCCKKRMQKKAVEQTSKSPCQETKATPFDKTPMKSKITRRTKRKCPTLLPEIKRLAKQPPCSLELSNDGAKVVNVILRNVCNLIVDDVHKRLKTSTDLDVRMISFSIRRHLSETLWRGASAFGQKAVQSYRKSIADGKNDTQIPASRCRAKVNKISPRPRKKAMPKIRDAHQEKSNVSDRRRCNKTKSKRILSDKTKTTPRTNKMGRFRVVMRSLRKIFRPRRVFEMTMKVVTALLI